MKRILLLFCLSALNTGFSQVPLNVDSLKAVIASYPKDDTVKAKLLITLSDALIKVNAKEGITYSDKALAILENFPALVLKADALATKSMHLKDLNKRKEALELAKQSLKTYEQLHLTKKVADVCNILGKIYDDESDLETGKKYYERAFALGEQTGDMKVKMLALNGLGLISSGVSDYKNAVLNFEQELALALRYNERKYEALALGNLGYSYYLLGSYAKAIDYHKKALSLNKSLGSDYHTAYNYRNLGFISMRFSEEDKALDYFNKALSLAIKTGNQVLTATVYTQIGVCYKGMKKYEEAIVSIEKGIEIDKKIGKDPKWLELGGVYETLSRRIDAHRCYQEALTVHRKLGNQELVAAALGQLGRIYVRASDPELLKIGINPTERFPQALADATEALEISQKIASPRRIVNALTVLTEVHEKNKDYVNAYSTYKKCIALKDSLKGVEVVEEITRKEIQYEFDKKETVFKYEQQLTAEQLEQQKLLTIQQGQALTLKEQALALSNKEKDLAHLAFLKEQAEKQEKEQALLVVQKDKDLAGVQILNLAKEKALQLQEIAGKNATIGFLGASVLAILLAAALFYLWLKKRQAQLEAARQAELQAAFTQQLFAETEAERARIARDLHDGISHELLGLKRSSFTADSEAGLKIDGVIESIRQISRNLHPVMLDSIGLQLSIETFCEQFGEAHNLFVNYDINYTKELNKNTELQVLRIVQEALNNAAKHAKAQAANVSMSDMDNGILLKIQDNGKGFDVKKAFNSGKAFGLQSIVERAKIIKTKATIRSSSKGTVIELKIA